MIAFRNGRFLPYSELAVAPHDAGFVFGATVTDFCRTYAHKLFRWPDHLARLRRDAAACFIPLPYSDEELTAAAEHLVTENAKGLPPDDDLALITFATPGPLGYMAGGAENGPPTVAMHTFPIPRERYRRFFTEGVELEVTGAIPPKSGVPPFVKHRSRMHWWQATRKTEAPGSVAALLAHIIGLDTAIGAVLGVSKGVVYRPDRHVVSDSISSRVIALLCRSIGMPCRIARQRSLLSRECTELLLVGSAFGIAGVRHLAVTGKRFDYAWPGPVFTQLAAAWSEMVGVDIVKQFTG